MELRWTPWPNLTNTRLLSSGIIWFWSQANIPWLDFVIDSARAVKVSQSPGTQTRARLRAHADLQLEFGTQSSVLSLEASGGFISGTDGWTLCFFVVFFFLGSFWNDGVCLHFLHFTSLVVTVAFRALRRQTKQHKADTSRRWGCRRSWRLVRQERRIFLDHFNGGLAVSVASGCWMRSKVKSLFSFPGKITKYINTASSSRCRHVLRLLYLQAWFCCWTGVFRQRQQFGKGPQWPLTSLRFSNRVVNMGPNLKRIIIQGCGWVQGWLFVSLASAALVSSLKYEQKLQSVMY